MSNWSRKMSERHHFPRRKEAYSWPLRKIVGWREHPEHGHRVMQQLLECGHQVSPSVDMFNAEREVQSRRCHRCAKELAAAQGKQEAQG